LSSAPGFRSAPGEGCALQLGVIGGSCPGQEFENCPLQVGSGQAGSGEVGIPEVRPLQVSAAQVRASEVGATEVHVLQMRVRPLDMPEINFVEV
jgi:hypothetical protein